jgi:hypothetical protein
VIIATSELLKYIGIFQRFIFSLGRRKQHKPQLFAKVIARRTNEISNIFDEQKVNLVQLPALESLLDHLRVQMADGAGCNQTHLGRGALKASGVILCRKIADQSRDAIFASQSTKHLLQKRRLA